MEIKASVAIAVSLVLCLIAYQNCGQGHRFGEPGGRSSNSSANNLPTIPGLSFSDGCDRQPLNDSNLRWILCQISIQNNSNSAIGGLRISLVGLEPATDVTVAINCSTDNIPAGQSATCDFDLTGGVDAVSTNLRYNVESAAGNSEGLFYVPVHPHELPKTLGDLVLWLRADSLTLADGAPVVDWMDVSGNSNNAAQSLTNLQPVFVKSAFNGRPAVWFDGVDDILRVLDNTTLWPSKLTVVAVVSFDVVESRPQTILSKPMIPNWQSFSLMYANGEFTWALASANLGAAPAWTTRMPYVAGRPYIVAGTFGSTVFTGGGDGSVFVDGLRPQANFVGSGYGANFSIQYAAQPLQLGRTALPAGPDFHLMGNIAEVLIFGQALTMTQRRDLEIYLGQKYGITVP